MKFALLVIDMQREFLGHSPETDKILEEASEYINEAIGLFRKKNLPIVAVYDVDESSSRVPGTESFKMLPGIEILASDIVIHKTHGNAFRETTLTAKLKSLGVDSVIVTGFCAEYCVLSTLRGGEDEGFLSVILKGSLASFHRDRIPFVEDISELVTFGMLEKILA